MMEGNMLYCVGNEHTCPSVFPGKIIYMGQGSCGSRNLQVIDISVYEWGSDGRIQDLSGHCKSAGTMI